MREDLTLRIVDRSEVGDRKVLAFTRYPHQAPFSTGDGPLNVRCGSCAFVLLEGAGPTDLGPSGLLIRCPMCRTLNSSPTVLS